MKLKQVEPAAVEIDHNKFYIRPFPAFTAANLTGELASTLAPLAGALAPLVSETDDLTDVDVNKAASAISSCTNISGDGIEKLMKKLLLGGQVAVEYEDENGTVQTERLDRDLADELFCGNVQNMFILAFHVIRLNFNGFFGKVSNLYGKAKSKEGQAQRKIV